MTHAFEQAASSTMSKTPTRRNRPKKSVVFQEALDDITEEEDREVDPDVIMENILDETDDQGNIHTM